MQRTNAGAVKGALHFHCPVLALQSGGAERSLFFLPRQKLFPRFEGGFDMGRHHFLQTLHQVANVFHRYPLNPGGIWLSGSLTVFTSRFGSPPLLARPICRLRASFCCHCT